MCSWTSWKEALLWIPLGRFLSPLSQGVTIVPVSFFFFHFCGSRDIFWESVCATTMDPCHCIVIAIKRQHRSNGLLTSLATFLLCSYRSDWEASKLPACLEGCRIWGPRIGGLLPKEVWCNVHPSSLIGYWGRCFCFFLVGFFFWTTSVCNCSGCWEMEAKVFFQTALCIA